MSKKCLITYSSRSGNTEKVASRFKDKLSREGWECDIVRISRKGPGISNPPFDMNDYDLVCVGSGLRAHLPYDEILDFLRAFVLDANGRIILRTRDEFIKEPLPAPPGPEEMVGYHRKTVLGLDSKKAIIFVTYAGYEFGPKEAQPALQLLDLDIEHLGFKCIGHFSCPGRFLDNPAPTTYHGDIRDRPNEKDLLRAEIFIEDRLEEIADRAGV
jgi:hypothetical protein